MISNNLITLEQEILGSLINNNSLITKCSNISANTFNLKEHKEIYKVILEMIKKDIAVDLNNLLVYSSKNTKNMGGITYLTDVANSSSSNANFEAKIDLLITENHKREIYKMTKKLQTLDNLDEMQEVISKTQEAIYKNDTTKELDIINYYDEYLQDLYAEQEKGFKTGLHTLDDKIGNLQRGRLVTFVARSGIGKSTLAIQIALNLVLQGHKVIYGTGETSQGEIVNKMCSSHLDIEFRNIERKILTKQEKDDIADFVISLINQKFHITVDTDINKLIQEVKLYKLKFGLDVLFVDYVNNYLGNIQGHTMTEKIGQVTSRLKALALEENICIVLLAQVNRRTDINDNKNIVEKISSSDIQDSARIEQDSDQVIAIYRNVKLDNEKFREHLEREGKIYDKSTNADENPNCVNLTILKNRHGVKTTLAYKWEGNYSRIKNFER